MRLLVHLGGDYEVVVENGILPQIGEYTAQIYNPCRLCIVTDSNVDALYSQEVTTSLEKAGFSVYKFVIEAGEDSKTLSMMSKLLEFLVDCRFNRGDKLIALGGGVVGDLTGFTAATYMRGIGYIQIPTSILAAADSSVGGKTAINLGKGKNLCGAFWQPDLVFCDTNLFKTLTPREFSCGMAEIIKMAVLFDKKLFHDVESFDETVFLEGRKPFRSCNSDKGIESFSEELLSRLVFRSIELKANIVEEDERDTGRRTLLNFGHTAGHAIESLSGYRLLHGEAIAIGMVINLKAAYRKGYMEKDLSVPLIEVLERSGISCECGYTAREITEQAVKDKKVSESHIDVIMLKDIGDAYLKQFPFSEFEDFVEEGLK